MLPIKVTPTGHEGEVFETFFRPNVRFSGTLIAQALSKCRVCKDPCYSGAVPVETRYYPKTGRLTLTGPNTNKPTCNIRLQNYTIEVDTEFAPNPISSDKFKLWKPEADK